MLIKTCSCVRSELQQHRNSTKPKAQGRKWRVPLWLQLIPQRTNDPNHTDLCAQLYEPFCVSWHCFTIYVTFADCGSCQIQLDLWHVLLLLLLYSLVGITGNLAGFVSGLIILVECKPRDDLFTAVQEWNCRKFVLLYLYPEEGLLCSYESSMRTCTLHISTVQRWEQKHWCLKVWFQAAKLRTGERGRQHLGESFLPNRGQRSERDPVRKQRGRSTLSVWSGDKI